MDGSLVFDFEIDIERLSRALDTLDDLGSVLRVHLELERALDHVIGRILPNPEKAGWRYPSQKINFLLALGVPDFRLKPAQIINSIRNNFAHKKSKEIVEERDVKELFVAINRIVGGRITDNFELVRKSRSSGTESRKKYGEMIEREKFCFLGFIAISLIAVFVNEMNLQRKVS